MKPLPVRRRGSALLLVLVVIALLGTLIAVGYGILSNASNASKIELELEGQTLAIAESGITEALSWFRRSPIRKSCSAR